MSETLKMTSDEFRKRIHKKADGSLELKTDQPLSFNYIPLFNNGVALNINPIGKPRMIRSDKWNKRPATQKYWQWKNDFLDEVKRTGISLENTNMFHMNFVIEMPASWSEKKKALYNLKPHQVKPDIDNILKAILDAVNKKDQTVYSVNMAKMWAYKGQIIILPNN